ncbi:MAG: hypothetical protein K8H84_01820 [Sulfuricella denitrificans]|nr:hypothetical protein [Sulfuricella denitrificans]
MSGPITAAFSFTPLGAVILAAQALKEARAMGQEYAEALEQAREREAEIVATRRQQRETRLQRQSALLEEVGRNERQLERLRGIVLALDANAALNMAPLQRPAVNDQETLAAHANTVREAIHRIEALLAQAGAGASEKQRALLQDTAAPDLDKLLAAYALQRSFQPGLDPEQTKQFSDTAARILERLELPEGLVMPHELERLARDIVLAPSLERAESLATELRLGVQRYHTEQATKSEDAAEALALLEALPDSTPAFLRTALEAVAMGTERLAPETHRAAQELLDAAQKAREHEEQEAAALVLEQSLRDLGYEVEGVESTLFVDGGVVHFQRPGWENYFVRMRLDAREKTLNFNVVRPRSEEDNPQRQRLDFLAEDRWCSEFPRLQQTLAARGLNLAVTRQLGAGELPVQAVDPATLPQASKEEERSRASAAPLHLKNP